ncbi:hypothetical protein [Phaeobacter sp.]|uniref:hypothetical protein n=1 Tax=Phaeobacter sp. TaxID=1902409 RepID=UPI0025DA4305|nr:hypothetical protein [Phaeobacter sp.]
MTSRIWISIGALAVIYGLTVTGCSPVADADGTPRIKTTAMDQPRLTEASALWSEENGAYGDPFTTGKAAYDIAQLTHDPKWAREAISQLEKARSEMPNFPSATAYLGSAHALMARDYPLQGAWQALPGPGFVRIYHVERAEALLSEAVAIDPTDPVARLIRAATIIDMPGVLADHDLALADFDQLAKWEAQPELNPQHADVLRSAKWRGDFYSAYTRVLADQGKTEQAATYQQKLTAFKKEFE